MRLVKSLQKSYEKRKRQSDPYVLSLLILSFNFRVPQKVILPTNILSNKYDF